mgnify:CR=1 FL=1|jgi:hypothetical protein
MGNKGNKKVVFVTEQIGLKLKIITPSAYPT